MTSSQSCKIQLGEWLGAVRPAQVRTPSFFLGTTDSLADARYLLQSPWRDVLRDWAAAGVPIVGVCGGYPLLGETIEDPFACDGVGGAASGLAFCLCARSWLEKIVRPVTTAIAGLPVHGYEIHHGRTTVSGGRALRLKTQRTVDVFRVCLWLLYSWPFCHRGAA